MATKWTAAVTAALAVLVVGVFVLQSGILSSEPSTPAMPVNETVEQQEPESVVEPAYRTVAFVAHRDGLSPWTTQVKVGENISLRFSALDDGAGDGYTFTIDYFDVNETVFPGSPQEVSVNALGVEATFTVDVRSGDIHHVGRMRVVE